MRNFHLLSFLLATFLITNSFSQVSLPGTGPGVLSVPTVSSIELGGYLGGKVDLCIQKRIKDLDFDQFVEPFRHRNETRLWQGEFFGKLMLAAISSYRYNRDPEMLSKIDEAFKGLMATQSADGYIGNYAENARLEQWDIWCRKYTLLSLLSYYDLTGNKNAMNSAVRLADYTMTQVGPGQSDIIKTGNYRGMPSCSILEPIVYLYRKTGDKKYLEFARYIAERLDSQDGPGLVRKALEGIPVAERFPFPKSWWSYENGMKAYEMMSCYEGLLELYKETGEKKYLEATELAVKNIIDTEINLAGSGSAFECWYNGAKLQAEPTYHMMETCVTFTWMKLCLNLLSVTGNSLYADQFERSMYNALLASLKGDGSQIAKYSPLEGTRSEGEKQCGMNINCCNANGPRGFMLIPSFACLNGTDGLAINLFCPFTTSFDLAKKNRVNIRQVTDYPVSDSAIIEVDPEKPTDFTLYIRIPSWSKMSEVRVNGISQENVVPGKYYAIKKEWEKGDMVEVKFDLRAQITSLNGYQAIVRGPVLLARDSRINERDIDEAAVIQTIKGNTDVTPIAEKHENIWMIYSIKATLGTNLEGEMRTPKNIYFCDFSSAGNSWDESSRYRVWIKQTLNVMNTRYKSYQ